MIMHLLYDDYNPLTKDQNLTCDNVLVAYRLHRPKELMEFLWLSDVKIPTDTSIQTKLRGPDGKSSYELYYEVSGLKVMRSGDELMSEMKLFSYSNQYLY